MHKLHKLTNLNLEGFASSEMPCCNCNIIIVVLLMKLFPHFVLGEDNRNVQDNREVCFKE